MFKRTDNNQKNLVTALRQLGFSVAPDLAKLGKGMPDLLVGKHGINLLLEVKNPAKPPSARALTDDEKAFHAKWRGQIAVVETVEDVLRIFGFAAKEKR